MKKIQRRQFLRHTFFAGLAGCVLQALPFHNFAFAKQEKGQGFLIQRSALLMGTFVRLQAYGDDELAIASIFQQAFEEMKRQQAIFSWQDESASLAQLNRHAELRQAPYELVQLLQRAKTIHAASDGLFNPSIKPYMDHIRRSVVLGLADAKNIDLSEQGQAQLALADFSQLSLQEALRRTDRGLANRTGGAIAGHLDAAMGSHSDSAINSGVDVLAGRHLDGAAGSVSDAVAGRHFNGAAGSVSDTVVGRHLGGVMGHQADSALDNDSHVSSTLLATQSKEYTIVFNKAHMQLTLDAIAKGAIVDACAQFLIAAGLEHFMIDAGGDIYAHGKQEETRPWRVGVYNPLSPSTLLARVSLEGQAIASSGVYERSSLAFGMRNHLLHPKTGHGSAYISSTVVAPKAADADALASSIALMEVKQALAFIDNFEGASCFLLAADGRSYQSKAWSKLLRV